MKVLIADITFVRELYPRFEADNGTINQYRQSINQLPPIILTKENVLVDGYHRLLAHKLEGLHEIEVTFIDCQDESEILIEAIKRNSTHGIQLSIKEKKVLARKLWELGVKDVGKIGTILSIEPRTVNKHTEDLRRDEKEQRDAEILELYLQCLTQEEIAKKLGITDGTVSNVLSKNGMFSEIRVPENLDLYNVWSVGKLDPDQLKYPGQTPKEIIENLVYYYTDPPELNPKLKISKVVDPMAGSGVVGNVCQGLMRRYMLFDLHPLREDISIRKNDILEGFPKEAKYADLVYFDPPYYNLMEEYPNNHFTESYESFLGAMKISLENIGTILNNNGKVAMILKPMNVDMLGGDWLDMTFDCVTIAKELGYKLIKRIGAPLSTQQFQAHDVSRAKEGKVMLNTLRDIVILRK